MQHFLIRKSYYTSCLYLYIDKMHRAAECTGLDTQGVRMHNPDNRAPCLVYAITLEDVSKWAARVPKHGTVAKFDHIAAITMKNNLESLCMIREKSAIPLPEVLHYNIAFDSPLEASSSLCKWPEGLLVSEVWHDRRGLTPYEQRRLKILDSFAEAAKQLSFLTHPSIGLPSVQSNAGALEIKCTEALRGRDWCKKLDFMFENVDDLKDEDGNPTIFYEFGPFTSAADYLRKLLDRLEFDAKSRPDWVIGCLRMMGIIIDAIDSIEKHSGGPPGFVLTHCDLHGGNVLANEDGSLAGVQDWDRVFTAPKQMGHAAYPHLLMRDMSSPWYYFWSNKEELRAMRDSPSDLRELRRTYRKLVEKHSGTAAAKYTVNSRLYRAVEEACMDLGVLVSIAAKLAKICIGGHLFEIESKSDGKLRREGPNESDDFPSRQLEQDYDDDESDYESEVYSEDPLESIDQENSTDRTVHEGTAAVRFKSWIDRPFRTVTNFFRKLVKKTDDVVGPSPVQSDDTDSQKPQLTASLASTADPEDSSKLEDLGLGGEAKDQGEDEKGQKDLDEVPEAEPFFISPNEGTPCWMYDLAEALGRDTVPHANIEILKNRFIEKFSSEEEVMEDWDLE